MNTPPTKKCSVCGETFEKSVSCSTKNWVDREYCSKRCSNSRVRFSGEDPIVGIVHGLTGYNNHQCRCDICREASRLRKRDHRVGNYIPHEKWGHKESENPAWKGDAVGYKNIHAWVRYHKSKSGICSVCHVDFGTERGHATHWANLDHQYRRILDDYVEMCPSCHKKYDLRSNTGRRSK